MKTCQAVSTLRSGKQVQKPDPPQQLEAEEDDTVEEEAATEDIPMASNNNNKKRTTISGEEEPLPEYCPPTSISSTFDARKKDKYQSDIKEIFAKCQINIPLLTAINRIPKDAKFLKELYTIKKTCM